jgi:hypothetical protein
MVFAMTQPSSKRRFYKSVGRAELPRAKLSARPPSLRVRNSAMRVSSDQFVRQVIELFYHLLSSSFAISQ